jgi:hypothetical protein
MASLIGKVQAGIADLATHKTVTLTQDTTGATLLVLVVSNGGNDPTGATITDSNNNTWHFVLPFAPQLGAAGGVTTFYAFDKTGAPLVVGPGHSVTVSYAVAAFQAVSFAAFSGTPTGANPFRRASPNTSPVANQVTVQPGQLNLNSDSLVITSYIQGGFSNIVSIGPPFTVGAIILPVAAVNWGMGMAWTETSSPINAVWTSANSAGSASQIVSFASLPAVQIFFARRFQLARGNRTISIVELGLDFSKTNSISINWNSIQSLRGVAVSSVFIDLSFSDSPVTITDNISGSSIIYLGRSQGWVPMLFNEPLQFTVSFNSGLQATKIILRFASELLFAGPWRTQ